MLYWHLHLANRIFGWLLSTFITSPPPYLTQPHKITLEVGKKKKIHYLRKAINVKCKIFNTVDARKEWLISLITIIKVVTLHQPPSGLTCSLMIAAEGSKTFFVITFSIHRLFFSPPCRFWADSRQNQSNDLSSLQVQQPAQRVKMLPPPNAMPSVLKQKHSLAWSPSSLSLYINMQLSIEGAQVHT